MEIRGLNTEKISAWLMEKLGDAESSAPFVPPYEFELIAAGGSNLTYKISDQSGASIALRRPPEAARLASAHDMGREWRVLSALANSEIPVPKCIAYEMDTEILGADFYIMDFIDGIILRDTKTAPDITAESAYAATESLIQVQAKMHTLDLEAVGLSDFGKHEDYAGRQLKRWKRQVDTGGVRNLPLHTELYERLLKSKPQETAPPALVHGDYRFDNCVLNSSWKIAAVLDWELCTIGNPIADFVWSLQYWADPGDEFTWLTDSPTLNLAFMNRQEYSDLYEEISSLDLSDIPYYTIFSWWKQASIVEGVYARILAGGGGGSAEESEGQSEGHAGRAEMIAERVDKMLAYAADMAAGVLD